jgi:hypothetical protein
MFCKSSVNPITNPNHVYSRTESCDDNYHLITYKNHIKFYVQSVQIAMLDFDCCNSVVYSASKFFKNPIRLKSSISWDIMPCEVGEVVLLLN